MKALIVWTMNFSKSCNDAVTLHLVYRVLNAKWFDMPLTTSCFSRLHSSFWRWRGCNYALLLLSNRKSSPINKIIKMHWIKNMHQCIIHEINSGSKTHSFNMFIIHKSSNYSCRGKYTREIKVNTYLVIELTRN